MRCSVGDPKIKSSLKIGPYLSNSRSYILYGLVKRSDLTKNSANDLKFLRGPGMSSKGRTEIFSVSDFAESWVWLSSSGGIALVFWNLKKTAKGFKCWNRGRFLVKVRLEIEYMFPFPGASRTMLVPVSYRHFSKWRTFTTILFLLHFGQGLPIPYGFLSLPPFLSLFLLHIMRAPC